jgi:predicted adenine nucleotide alpha hydrolase (AANH) superfamily ATPase
MQKYCGCIFSEEDRYKEKIEKDIKKFLENKNG